MITDTFLANKEQICKSYLHKLCNPQIQTLTQQKRESIVYTYGEILYPSINKIIKNISWQPDDVFLDLGSGIGKLALQIFLLAPVKCVYGIEYLTDLHEYASLAANKLQSEAPVFFTDHRKLAFFQGDFLKEDWMQANILMICSPCFGPSLLYALGHLINERKHIHTVITLRPINTLTRLPFKNTFRIEGSWDTALCYLYTSL